VIRPATTKPELAAKTLPDDAVLVARGLTKHFRIRSPNHGGRISRRAVVHAAEDVDLRLLRGTITAVVGESGSGKTTVARMLARLVRPTSGSIVLNGHERSLSDHVQLVLQDPLSSLNPVHDVHYHLARPLQIHRKARRRAAVTAAVDELLATVKLEPAAEFAHKMPHELSGGQRQRVAIARALAAGPSVLLADEPISMLDVSIRLGILNLIEELREREGLTVLYVTHDIASARYFADTITVMYAGRVVERGSTFDVTDQPAHPYTSLLLRAAPDPERPFRTPLRARGGIPSLVQPPSGCRFHPRCPYAMPVCSVAVPPELPIADGRTAACWLHDPDHGQGAKESRDTGTISASSPAPPKERKK
jgi:peptide/nickel transport system ATP-binding protein